MMIDQHTALYGVVGCPLGHSLSPAMHNAAFSERGLNAVYLAFETMDMENFIRGVKSLNIKGVSVTMPNKSVVTKFLDDVDDLAERIGAVNTIVNADGRLVGYNTDAPGAIKAIEERVELWGRNCLLIGAGGAAKAIGYGLKEYGVHLTIANRSPSRGRALADHLECSYVPLEKVLDVEADLLIQTTPVGMVPSEDPGIVPPELLEQGMVVMDIVYRPVETELLRTARTRGCVTINGLGMFVHQGAEQFRLWTGLCAPLSAMTAAVEDALRRHP